MELLPEITSPGAEVMLPPQSSSQPFPSAATCACAEAAAHRRSQTTPNEMRLLYRVTSPPLEELRIANGRASNFVRRRLCSGSSNKKLNPPTINGSNG